MTAALLLLLACRQQVTRSRWEQMPPSQKTVYVRSLLGGEKAKSAKGKTGARYSQPPETYVKQISDAYSRGDKRDPETIFSTLADRP